MRLAEKVRPKQFEHVIGQRSAVAVLLRWSRERTGESVILSGPPGSGKTTLAEIYANGLLCQHGTGSPCLQKTCQDCRDNLEGSHVNRRLLEGGVHDEGKVAEAISREPSASMGGGRLVIVLDRAERISSHSFDLLRTHLERSEPGVTFVICTERIDALPAKIRHMFVGLPLVSATLSDRQAYLGRLERKIEATVPAEVMTLVVEHAGQSLEEIARDFEALRAQNALTLEGVRQFYRLEDHPPVLDYLRALAAEEPLEAQVAALSLPDLSPAERIEEVEAALSMLFHGQVLQLDLPGGKRVPIGEEIRHELVEKLTGCGNRLGLVPRQFWQSLLALWHPDPSASEWTLRNKVAECQRFLQDPDAHQSIRDPDVSGKRQRQRGRPRTRLSGLMRGSAKKRDTAYLTREEVQGLWEAAAFMVQTQGVFFNARLEFRHQALGKADPQEVGPLMTSLTHEMRMQVSRWVKAKPHCFAWAYVHERIGQPDSRTCFALHVPADALGLESYIRDRLLGRHCPQHDPLNSLTFTHQGDGVGRSGGDNGGVLGVHLGLLRWLSQGLDPECRVSASPISPLLRDVLRVSNDSHMVGQLSTGQRCGVSRDIDEKARNREGEQLAIPSAWDHGLFSISEEGFDFREHEERTKAKAQLADMLALLAGDGPVWAVKRRAYIKEFRDEWGKRATQRIRNGADFHNSLSGDRGRLLE